MGLTKSNAISLAWHGLYIGAIIFVGLLLSSIVGGLVGGIPVVGELGDLLAESIRSAAIVTAVLYAIQVGSGRCIALASVRARRGWHSRG